MSWRAVRYFYREGEVLEDQDPTPTRDEEVYVPAVVGARVDAPGDHALKYHRHVRLAPLSSVSDPPAFQGDLPPQVAGGEPVADELAEVRHDCLWLGVPPKAYLDTYALP